MTYLLQQIDYRSVATDESSIGRNLNSLLLFYLLPTDGLSAATDQSSVVRKLDHFLLFCFVPIDGPSVATDGSSVATDGSSIVHPWLVPTEQELQMSFFLTLGIIDTKSDPTVDLIKKELAGATTIKRETPIVSGDADDVAIDVDVNVIVDIGDVGAKSGGEHIDDVGGIYGGFTPFSGHTTSFAPSNLCFACKCEECKNKDAHLISTGEEVS
ncbi:hypothetical protein KY284_011081 [Solanum tuberosum]|nr:hypothetical protein KY284_011081 [Solanum tuberosum]